MDLNKLKGTYMAAFPHANKRYLYLGSFQVITQILVGLLFWGMIINLQSYTLSEVEGYYNCFSFCFYIFFLSSLRRIIRRFAKIGSMNDAILNWIRFVKWGLLLLSITLIVLNFYTTDFTFDPQKFSGDKAAYHLTHTIPALLNHNIAFMIITFLAFYVSEIMAISKKLKEEQSLTI